MAFKVKSCKIYIILRIVHQQTNRGNAWAFEIRQAPVGPDGIVLLAPSAASIRNLISAVHQALQKLSYLVSIKHFGCLSSRHFWSLLARWSYLPDGPDGEKSPMGPMERKARWRPIARCARWTYLPDEPDGPDGHICPMGPMDIFARCARWPDCPMAVAHQASNAEA